MNNQEESKAEPDLRLLQLRPSVDSQVSDNGISLINRESVTSDSGAKNIKLSVQDEEGLKQLVSRNSDEIASLRHILSVYNLFY